MYEIFIKTHFSAAHFLRNYPGNCEHLHGHNWDVEVVVGSQVLNDIDVAMDFRDLKKLVGRIMSELDHINLNDHPAFSEVNPSSERIAEYIFRKLRDGLESFSGITPLRVVVCETPRTGVIYYE